MSTNNLVKLLLVFSIFNFALLGIVLLKTEKLSESANEHAEETQYSEQNSISEDPNDYAAHFAGLVLNIGDESFDDSFTEWPINSIENIRDWVVEKSPATLAGFNPAETYMLRKGQYAISIGSRPTGVDSCYPEYFVIQNKEESKTLGLLTRSDLKNPLDYDAYLTDDGQFLTLTICENNISTTNIGSIDYKIPKQYDPQIIEEMDTIVRAISVKENRDYYCYPK
jgi:hypothetical protein